MIDEITYASPMMSTWSLITDGDLKCRFVDLTCRPYRQRALAAECAACHPLLAIRSQVDMLSPPSSPLTSYRSTLMSNRSGLPSSTHQSFVPPLSPPLSERPRGGVFTADMSPGSQSRHRLSETSGE